jgi:hypothetical protein
MGQRKRGKCSYRKQRNQPVGDPSEHDQERRCEQSENDDAVRVHETAADVRESVG